MLKLHAALTNYISPEHQPLQSAQWTDAVPAWACTTALMITGSTIPFRRDRYARAFEQLR
jgi:hypothetical protein